MSRERDQARERWFRALHEATRRDHRAEPGKRRLIVCHHPDRGGTLVEVAAFLTGEGYRVVGRAGMETVDLAWTDREPAREDACPSRSSASITSTSRCATSRARRASTTG